MRRGHKLRKSHLGVINLHFFTLFLPKKVWKKFFRAEVFCDLLNIKKKQKHLLVKAFSFTLVWSLRFECVFWSVKQAVKRCRHGRFSPNYIFIKKRESTFHIQITYYGLNFESLSLSLFEHLTIFCICFCWFCHKKVPEMINHWCVYTATEKRSNICCPIQFSVVNSGCSITPIPNKVGMLLKM